VSGKDGSAIEGPLGTAVVPGHAIEDMWFQMEIARDRGDQDTIQRCAAAVKTHVEAGWDEEFGGIYLAIDADQVRRGERDAGAVAWQFSDSKLWWPHTEALYALLLSYEHTEDTSYLDWFDKVDSYSFRHFPSGTELGEWRQKLDRQGRPFSATVALPVKDPFHLPRALILCIEVLERLLTPTSSAAAPPPAAMESQSTRQEDKMASPSAEALRRKLQTFYAKYAPDEAAKVENLVARVVGGPPSEVGGMLVGGVLWSEDELFEKLEAKYGDNVERS
jgi:hypothetical protein